MDGVSALITYSQIRPSCNKTIVQGQKEGQDKCKLSSRGGVN